MRTSRLFIFSFIFTAFVATSAFAQAIVPAKIALVNTDAFYAEQGITKIAVGYKSLDEEFKKEATEIDTMARRLQALQTEVQNLQAKANDPNNKIPINREAAQAKVDEGEKLQRDLKFKQEDVKLRYDKREAQILGPIIQDIGKAISDYSKQKGYTLVLDSGKLAQAQMLLYLQETTDITKDFIVFYNARPAGTAVTKP